jgi:membrane protein DedA with SNARE-associated domain
MTDALAHLGPVGIFLLMVPESACVPVPSELTLLAAGFAVHEGWMPFAVAVIAATAGNLVGSMIAYGFGRVASRRLLWAWGRTALGRCDAVFSQHGPRAVFLARLMPFARTFVSLPAGHARVAIAPFVAMTAAGCAIWAAMFVLAGTLLGTGWRAADNAVGVPLLAIGAVMAGAAVLRSRGQAR